MSMGSTIAEARKKCGMTQESLAEKVGVSFQAVSIWENDKSLPDTEHLKKLACALGVTVDSLMRFMHGQNVSSIHSLFDGQIEAFEFEVTDDNINSVNGGYSGGGSSNPSGSSGGAWLTDSNGRWYINADRSYTVSNWQKIDGYWFYFDERGYVKTGWLQSPSSGLWYYLSPDQEPLGHMVTNAWIGQYYVNSDGVWAQ